MWTVLKRVWCLITDHNRVSDDTFGGYGWTCSCCHKNDYGIHDM